MNIPISLYIHSPWCIKKCPYCDFNSHAILGEIPEVKYEQHLQKEFNLQQHLLQERPISTIFIGGGTPSLLEANTYQKLFAHIEQDIAFTENIEITLEANPGAVEQQRFKCYREIGINRLSIGVQSFNDAHLKLLGRIHDSSNAHNAINIARQAGFDNFNIDIMFGLPQQNIEHALQDLQTAISLEPTHISWYQLTLEPNTLFYRFPPTLPDDDQLWDMQQQGQQLLANHGYQQYEVSAYAKTNKQCQHNLNYWLFGDYLGIGAGAHGKITDLKNQAMHRRQNIKNPRDYMNDKNTYLSSEMLIENPLFDFMLNALRLNQPITIEQITSRTFLSADVILSQLQPPIQQGFITINNNVLSKTDKGVNFLNDLVACFLPMPA